MLQKEDNKVTFLLGRPASRYEEVVVNKIKRTMGDDPLMPILVIVPPQATYTVENMLMQGLGVRGIMGVDVVSLSRLTQRIFDEVHGVDRKTIGRAGKSMVIRNILDQQSDSLESLMRAHTNAALPPLISDIITEFKQLHITPDSLRDLDTKHRVDTKNKLNDLAVVYEQLSELLCDYADAEDKLDIAAQYIHQADFIKNAHVFVHGFDMHNEQTVNFLSAIMQTAKHTTITFLYADHMQADSGVYAISDEKRRQFHEIASVLGYNKEIIVEDAARSLDILHIQKNLFAHPITVQDTAKDVRISVATTLQEEINGVAAQIAYLTQKKGYLFRDIAIVCGDAENYLPKISNRFKKVNIPCYTGNSRKVLESNLAAFILSALDLSHGRIKKDDLMKHMACGYTKLSHQQSAQLLNYAYENVRDGFAFLHEFDEPQEAARKALMQPVEQLRKNASQANTTADLVNSVFMYMEKVELQKKVQQQANHMREQNQLESAEFLEQSYERIINLLEQSKELPCAHTVGRDLSRLLRAGMMADQINTIPLAVDEVLCGDISVTYLPDVKVLFVMGVNDGSIPNYKRAPDMLTEAEHELILRGIAGLEYTGAIDREKLSITKALSRPSEKLYLSYIDDDNQQKSSLIDRLLAIFKEVPTHQMSDVVPMLAENAFDQTAQNMRMAADGLRGSDSSDIIAASVLEMKPFAKDILLLREGAASKIESVPVHTGKKLYGTFQASATRIETFYRCPYMHFVNYGLKAYVPQEHTVNPLDIGSYAHSLLDGVSKAIEASGQGWRNISPNELDNVLVESVQNTRKQQPKYLLNQHNETVLGSVEQEVKTAAHIIREQSRRGALQPYKTEFAFEVQDIRGIVDRIDTAKLENNRYFSVVDYKTGENDFDVNEMMAGVDLQLMIYIMAVQQLLGEEYIFAGANYMRIYSTLREPGQLLAPLHRMRGITGVPPDQALQLYGGEKGGSLFSAMHSVNKNGSYNAYSQRKNYSTEELFVLTKYVIHLIEQAKQKIKSGANEIVPYRENSGALPCRYCEFGSICMIDSDDPKAPTREQDNLKREDALQLMSKTLEAQE